VQDENSSFVGWVFLNYGEIGSEYYIAPFLITFCSATFAKKTLTSERSHFAIGYYIGLSYVLLLDKSCSNTLIINTRMQQVFEPQIQVRNNCFLLYYLPTVRGGKKPNPIIKHSYSGKVTNSAMKRMRSAIDILVQISPKRTTWNPVTKKYFPFDLNFITLTIASGNNLDASFCFKKLLEPFLRKMRNIGNFSYVWKLELQKRGQVHYHLATNLFLPWQDIRSSWNNLQRKNRLLDEYAKKEGHFNANGTDVHALANVRDVEAYMAKYLSKTNTTAIKGKVWDCSTDLKRKRFAFTPTGSQEMYMRQLQNDRHIKVIDLEHCTIIKGLKKLQLFTPQNFIDYQLWKQ
jgi:hypothetical protein